MVRATFRRAAGQLRSVEVSGHAGCGEAGEDIVCASVTSALQLVCNAVTEVQKLPAQVLVEENRIRLTLPEEASGEAERSVQALLLQLRLLEQEYPQNIKTTVLEV